MYNENETPVQIKNYSFLIFIAPQPGEKIVDDDNQDFQEAISGTQEKQLIASETEMLNQNLTNDGKILFDTELAFASREALFDPNSQVDLLEDFEIPSAPASEVSPEITMNIRQQNEMEQENVVVIGVNLLNEDVDVGM